MKKKSLRFLLLGQLILTSFGALAQPINEAFIDVPKKVVYLLIDLRDVEVDLVNVALGLQHPAKLLDAHFVAQHVLQVLFRNMVFHQLLHVLLAELLVQLSLDIRNSHGDV